MLWERLHPFTLLMRSSKLSQMSKDISMTGLRTCDRMMLATLSPVTGRLLCAMGSAMGLWYLLYPKIVEILLFDIM